MDKDQERKEGQTGRDSELIKNVEGINTQRRGGGDLRSMDEMRMDGYIGKYTQ